MAWSDIVTAPPPQAPGPKPTPEQLANLPSAVGYASPQLPPRPQMQQAMPVDVPLPPPGEATRVASKPTIGPSVLGIPLLPQPGEAKKEITPESLGQKQVPEADKAESETKTVTPESLGQKQVPEPEQKTGPETKAVTPESLGQKQVPEVEPPPPPPPPPQAEQLTTPMPSSTGAGAPQGAPGPLIPGRDAHISTLIASGKTPGEAQAIADGQEAKTLNGQAPQPKPKQPPDIGTLAGEQAYVTGAPVSGVEQQQPAETTKPTTSQQQVPEAPTTPKPAPADTTGVADFFRKRGDQPITSSNDPRLTTVNAGGQTWQVNKEAAPAFQGFVSELASKGAPITLGTGGGWAYREKVGAKGISEHAYGGAIDVNQLPGQRGKITPEFQKWIAANPGLLQQIEKHWNIYGGERFGDLGHFEWGGVPISTTKIAATTGAAAQPAALGPDDVQVAAQLDKNLGGLLKGKGSVYVAMGKKYGVDPRLLAAISMEETGNGTSHLLRTRNNVGGITGKGHSGVGGDYMPYNSIEEGIEAEASLIRHGYVGQGLDTIEKIGAKWAPGGAPNDPQGTNLEWPNAVRKFYAALGGTGKLGETSGEYPTFAASSGAGPPLPGGQPAAQPMVSIPSAGGTPQISGGGPRGGGWGGDSGYGGGSEASSRTAEASPINLTSLLEAAAGGAAVGSLFRGGGGQAPAQHPAEEEPPPAGGMKPANVLGVRTISPGPPPPAPSSLQAQLLAPPAAPGLPSPGSSAAAQAAMPSPLVPPKGPDPDVVKALMKRGFTRQQAVAFAAKATVSKPGAAAITGGASFKPPAQPSGAPPAKAPPAPTPSAAAPPAKQVQVPPQPRVATRIGPEGSTVGVPNPPGGPSPDDPRVKKQKDNLTKGEHFVPGDDAHDQLLSGLPGGHGGRQRQILGQAEQAISDKTPLHLSYISAPKEAAKFPTRESRTVQYDEHSPEARLMGTTEGQLVGHSLIPTAVGISPSRKANEPHQGYIQGISTNVMANNFQHILTKLAAMDRKSPYTKMGQKFANDLEGYLANLQAGHTGTGRGYAIGTEEYPSVPDESHVPYKLTRGEADFLNLVINNTGAFAKHEDGQALRELARANGTLINEKGETNRLRHQIEQHEPGWRERVLEPTIRSFKAGLIHEIHPTEEHMPESIRPGKEYHSLTEATARTSQRGRPDVPVAVSLHHTFTDNKRINQIERDFSDERIDEAEARARLKALGENPDEYQFIGGSGGLITPYEEDPEAITPEEHTELKTNLRKQWIGGKMPIEDYRRKAAEVPLPEKPSQPPAASPATPETETAPSPKPITPVKPKPPKPQPEPEPEPATAEETPETPAPAPKPAAPVPKPKAAAKAPQGPPEAPGEKPAHTFKEVTPEEFIAHRNKSAKPEFLSDLKPEEIQHHKLFTNQDNTIGAAVSPEGDIQNVFNNGGEKGAGAHAVAHAIEHHGGRTLDAYDGFLPDYYRQFGFHETGRTKFNPEFAPKWDTAKHGTPDVVHMGWGGHPEGGPEAAVARAKDKSKTNWIPNEQSTLYDDDFDAQKARSREFAQKAVAGGAEDYRTAGVEQGPKALSARGTAQPGSGAAPRGTVAPAPGDILPPAKPKKGAKTKEQSGLEAQDFEQAAADRDNISPEDAGRLARIQKIAKGWVKKNPNLHDLSMHAYLTGKKQFPGKLNKEQIGEHFDATNPKLDYSKEEHRQKASDAVVHDIMHSLAGTTTGRPSTAYGWYDRTVRKTMAKVGEIAPEILTDPDHAMAFKLALAITSQGQDVFPNAESAWHIYQHWLKHGEMPTDRKVFGGGIKAEAMEANLGKVNDLWKEHGTEGLHKILMSRMTSRELKQQYGLDSGEKADHVVNGAMGLGPKIGAFFSNLNGDFDPTTIDLWFSRNMNLMAGNMFGFSDKATRQDRMEKGEVVKSHLSELKDLLDSGMVSVPRARAAKMAKELGKLQRVPEGKLDRPTAKALAPEIYDWAREQHKVYQKSEGYERSYHPDLKTKDNVTAKKLDEGVTGLSDDPRTTAEREYWRDIMARADKSLKGAKVHLTNADKQALLWFNIKDLFKMAGSPQRPKADYLDAAHRLVRKVKSGELPGLQQGSQPPGGVLKMQGGGIVPDPDDPDPDPSPLEAHLGGVLAGHGADFEAAGAKYGVDPILLASIATFESDHGRSPAARNYNNVMGVSTPSPHHKFDSVEDSIDKGASNLSRNYLQQGLTTIPQIGAVYSPVRPSGQRVSNDPRGTNKEWPDTVQKFYTQMGGTNTFFGPQTVGVGVNMMGDHPQPPPPSPNWSPSPGEAPPPNQPPPIP
jgi:beta-N-acetylglucosaminidase